MFTFPLLRCVLWWFFVGTEYICNVVQSFFFVVKTSKFV